MVRGFLYAGSQRVVASFWKVDDEATGDLMQQFYVEMLQNNRSPAAALRQARSRCGNRTGRRSQGGVLAGRRDGTSFKNGGTEARNHIFKPIVHAVCFGR